MHQVYSIGAPSPIWFLCLASRKTGVVGRNLINTFVVYRCCCSICTLCSYVMNCSRGLLCFRSPGAFVHTQFAVITSSICLPLLSSGNRTTRTVLDPVRVNQMLRYPNVRLHNGHFHGRPSSNNLLPSLPSVFSIFEKRRAGDDAAEDKKPFRWLTPSLGPTRSCLHGVHLAPTASERVAAFDLDGTIIKSSYIQVGRAGGKQRVMKRQTNRLEWEWWRAVVPQKLKEVHDSGCALLLSVFSQNFCVPPSLISVLLSCSDIVLNIIDAQVLCCANIEPGPEILGTRRMEEKDLTDCRCSAYHSRRHSLSSFDFCA